MVCNTTNTNNTNNNTNTTNTDLSGVYVGVCGCVGVCRCVGAWVRARVCLCG